MQCAFCKDTIDDGSFFCDMCGEEVKLCPACNKTGKGKACTSCGKLLVLAKNSTAETNSEADVSSSPAYQSPQISSAPEPAPHSSSLAEKTARIKNRDSTISSVTPQKLRLINKNINVDLEISDNTVLGRKQGNYVTIFSPYLEVSGKHCRFHFNANEGWHVTDLGSTNGTRIDKAPLNPNVPHKLHDKVFLKIANIEFYVSIG